MATKYKTNKRKISSLVKQQVPQFVLEEHPKFTEFLSSYFLFMESAELNLTDITESDNILLETEGTGKSYGDNRQTMYASGLWGVPSFRLLNPAGEVLLATWGQDRLWLIAHTLHNVLQRDAADGHNT